MNRSSGVRRREVLSSMERAQAIRCDHDGLKMAEVQNGHLILRTKHHGETHVKIVALAELDCLGEIARLESPPNH